MSRLFWEYSIDGIFLSCAVPFAGLALIPVYLIHNHFDLKKKQRLDAEAFKYAFQTHLNNQRNSK